MQSADLLDWIRKLCGYQFPRLGHRAFQWFFSHCPPQVDSELLPGIRVNMNLRDTTQQTSYWQGPRYEWPTPVVLSRWAEAGATHFFDIGSNYGFYSYLMLVRFPGIDVHAFEPNPRTFAGLLESQQRNGLAALHVHQVGLSDVADVVEFRASTESSGHSSFGPHPKLSVTDRLEVVPFDDWAKRAGLAIPPRPAWIAKIDVEGYECRVLAGMSGALEARAFLGLCVEINPFTLELAGTSPEAVISLLEGFGYMRLTVPVKRIGRHRTLNVFFAPGGVEGLQLLGNGS